MSRSALPGLAAALTFAAPALAAGPADIDALRWKSRLLVVVAPSADDLRIARQRQLLAAGQAGSRERDLVLVEAVGPAGAATRKRFDVPEGAFRAILVGKDGGAKLSDDAPIAPERLFAEIDTMPMRRDEMHEARRTPR